jgi:hypothetical protein
LWCVNSQSESWSVVEWSGVTEIHVKRQVVEVYMNFEGILRFCPQAYRLLKGSRHLFGKIFGITATFGGVRASTTTNKKKETYLGREC